ncbi:MAG: right-handed parallel beta-helix repeat-containing protein [Saprospirales bacterium]|nr:right-handed parallel beta-helix repeat-containing protein [Saprospirales bacterium]
MHGFKVAPCGGSWSGRAVENSDFSYNYRPRLRSIREREDFFRLAQTPPERPQRMAAPWRRHLPRQLFHTTVRNRSITGNQNALLMTRSDDGFFTTTPSVQLRPRHRPVPQQPQPRDAQPARLERARLLPRFYQRGQDSGCPAAVRTEQREIQFRLQLLHPLRRRFFLWAQSTMDSGQGGCNDNIVFGNDFSHAPTNGVEVTFSRNRIQGNLMRECTYGIWGGYSFESVFMGNLIADCRTGIAIEHGQNNTIRQNFFEGDSTGIRLWARAQQPADWVYAQKRDTRSRDGLIDRNVFLRVPKPLIIAASQNIAINGENLFTGYQTLLETAQPNERLSFLRNDVYGSTAQIERVWAHPELTAARGINFSHPDKQPQNPYAPLEIPFVELKEPDSLPGGINTALSPEQLRTCRPASPYRFEFQRFEKNWTGRCGFQPLGQPEPAHSALGASRPCPSAPHSGKRRPRRKTLTCISPGGTARPRAYRPTTVRHHFHNDIRHRPGPLRHRTHVRRRRPALPGYGRRLIDHWDVHEPAVDEIEVTLGAGINIRIEHFEAGGFGLWIFGCGCCAEPWAVLDYLAPILARQMRNKTAFKI